MLLPAAQLVRFIRRETNFRADNHWGKQAWGSWSRNDFAASVSWLKPRRTKIADRFNGSVKGARLENKSRRPLQIQKQIQRQRRKQRCRSL